VRASRPEVPPRRMRVRTAQRPAELLADAHACVPQHSSPLCTFHEAVALMQARRRNAINVAGEATGSVTLPQPRVHKTCRLRLDNGCGEGLPQVKRRANGRFWEISINAECVCCSARGAKRGPGDVSRSRQLARAPCVSRGRASSTALPRPESWRPCCPTGKSHADHVDRGSLRQGRLPRAPAGRQRRHEQRSGVAGGKIRQEITAVSAHNVSRCRTWPRHAAVRCGSKPLRTANADVAQLVEHFTRNEGVRGSSPRVGSGEVACKSAVLPWRFRTRLTTNVICVRRTTARPGSDPRNRGAGWGTQGGP
jgi:hypothetical protein